MLNKRRRENNKSRGPWGMRDFNFTYRKAGDPVERHRFIQAPSEEGAESQFKAIMEKADVAAIIVSIEETEK
jgi:hypothetical protein